MKSIGMIRGEHKSGESKAARGGARLEADIVLGMPSRKCMYHGICRIEPAGKLLSMGHSSFAKASVQVSEHHAVTFHFHIDSMSEQTIRQHFSKGVFTVLEPIELPLFVANELGRTFTLQAGIYSIETGDEFYSVTFY